MLQRKNKKKVESCFLAQYVLVDNKVSKTYSLVSYLCPTNPWQSRVKTRNAHVIEVWWMRDAVTVKSHVSLRQSPKVSNAAVVCLIGVNVAEALHFKNYI